jgi:hypothetical protein
MNCQDIAGLLNDRNFQAISDADRRQAEVHLALCPVCAGEWEVALRLRADKIPAMPAFLRQWHPAGAGGRSISTARRRGRLLVIPVLLLAGVAAAVLWLYARQPDSENAPAADAGSLAEDAAITAGAESVDGNEAPSQDPADTAVPDDSAPAPRYRLVVMGPMQMIDNVAAIQAVEGTHRGLLEFFRSRPELDVIVVTQTEVDAVVAELGLENVSEGNQRDRAVARHFDADYSVRVANRYLRAPDIWTISVSYQYSNSLGRGGGSIGFLADAISQGGESPDAKGTDVAEDIYARLFPEAGTANLLSVVGDSAGSPAERLDAFRSVLIMNSPYRPERRVEFTPQAIAGAIEIGRSAVDATNRRYAWALLAQTGDPAVAQPMTDALLYDADANVRATAAEWLLEYSGDPVVRAALESSAVTDSSLDVRVRARWSTLASQDRAGYVRATLLDPRLTPLEQIAPLILARSERYREIDSSSRDSEIAAVDGAALDALAGIARSSNDGATRVAALTELGLGGHSEFQTLLQTAPEDQLRQVTVNLINRSSRTGVKIQLEQMLAWLPPDSGSRDSIESSLSSGR